MSSNLKISRPKHKRVINLVSSDDEASPKATTSTFRDTRDDDDLIIIENKETVVDLTKDSPTNSNRTANRRITNHSRSSSSFLDNPQLMFMISSVMMGNSLYSSFSEPSIRPPQQRQQQPQQRQQQPQQRQQQPQQRQQQLPPRSPDVILLSEEEIYNKRQKNTEKSYSPKKQKESAPVILPNCPICMDSIKVVTGIHCGHFFCYACIREWLMTNRICPVCRKKTTLGQLIKYYV